MCYYHGMDNNLTPTTGLFAVMDEIVNWFPARGAERDNLTAHLYKNVIPKILEIVSKELTETQVKKYE